MEEPLVSVIVVTHNHKEYIMDCIKSLKEQSYRNMEIIVVDSASEDGCAELVKRFEGVKVLESRRNLGYGGGNNLGISLSKGELVAILNPDTVADKMWLEELVKAKHEHGDAFIVASKVLLPDGRINACGNDVHYTGLTFARGFRENQEAYGRVEEIIAPSGAAFLVDRSMLEDVGLMDEFMSNLPDTDLALRALLRGKGCLYVPGSKVVHRFKLKMDRSRFFALERDRYVMVIKNFGKRLLVSSLPALVFTEVLTWGFALIKGYVREKVKAVRWVKSRLKQLVEKRRDLQGRRKVDDKRLIELMSYEIKIPEEWLFSRILAKVLEGFFNFLYHVNYRFVRYVLSR